MPKLVRAEDQLELSLSGSKDFGEALKQAKAIPGRRFDGEKKVWCYPADAGVAERILHTIPGILADVALISWVRAERAKQSVELATKLPDDAELRIPWANKLRSYQRAFVSFAVEHPHCLLGDDMGLGKTAAALATTAEYIARGHDDGPKLAIAPNSVKGTWVREIRLWYGEDYPYQIIDGSTKQRRQRQLREIVESRGFAIINWEKLRTDLLADLNPVPWLGIYADEVHRAKNRKAKQTQALWTLQAPIQLALSGTPLMNRPDELWSILAWLYPESYHKNGRRHNGQATAFWTFFDEYTEAYEGYKGKVVTGVKNPDALRFELKDRLVRRTKGTVLDLPEKVRQFVPIEMSAQQRKMYTEAETKLWFEVEQDLQSDDEGKRRTAREFVKGILEGKRLISIPNAAARTTRLRQVNCNPSILGGPDVSAKMDAAQEIILDNQPKQFIVYCEFKPGCDVFVKRLRDAGLTVEAYHGDVPQAARTKIEDKFQAGDIDVLVGTIRSMGFGLTLTAADTAIFIDRSWVPAENEQAEDRLHRIGQHNNVTIVILESTNTVDTQKLAPTNRIKSLIVGAVTQQDEVREIQATEGASL